MEKIFLSDFPALVQEWHPFKNGELTPDKVTPGSSKKVWWLYPYDDPITKQHFDFEWQASIAKRVKGQGCPYLTGKKVWIGFNDLSTVRPDLLAQWDFNRNAIIPTQVTRGSKKKVWWKCDNGHSWEASIVKRVEGQNCPYCSGKKIQKGFNDLFTTHPNLKNEWNWDENNINPETISAGSHKKVWWRCAKGHEWQAVVSTRVNGTGCPKCSEELRTSFPEKVIYYYAKKFFTTVIPNYIIPNTDGMELDIYIPDYGVGIEYDGEFWHRDFKRDVHKNKVCRERNIILFRIREPKCPVLNDSSNDIILKNKKNDLERGVIELFQFISNCTGISINTKIINIKLNQDEIYSEMIFSEKGKSIYNLKKQYLNEWDYEKNCDIRPENVLPNSTKEVWWKCKNGHHYKMKVVYKNKGFGCPICSGKRVQIGYNDLATTDPNLAKEWDWGKNVFTPMEVTRGSEKKVWWICKNNHSYLSTVVNRIAGNGCPYCSGQRTLPGYNDLTITNPELIKEWDYEKNEITPTEISSGSKKKVWWKCKEGHSWQASINNRAKKHSNCPYCSGRFGICGVNDIATTHPDIAAEWDYEKNKIDITLIKAGSNRKVWWKCKEGHSWQAIVAARCKQQSRCPMCNKKIYDE